MDLTTLRSVLGWCAVLNLGLLLWWWGFFVLAHDLVFRMHTRWFALTREQFDAIHYAGMAYLKLTVFVFILVPYLALLIVGS